VGSPGVTLSYTHHAEPSVEIQNLVVVRYLDGRVLKGTTRDFSANRPMLHVQVDGTTDVLEIRCRLLKAIFFVKTFEGDPGRQDVRGFIDGPQELSQGRKIAVRFRDGEFMCGYTLSWLPEREGFFMFPADPDCNNQRVYVLSAAALEVKAGPQAEALAKRVLSEPAARPGSPAASPNVRPLTPNSGNTAIGPRPPGVAPRPPGLMRRPPATGTG
jgi:hypothetical protein